VPEVWTIVVAGGSGQRFGHLKQFSSLGGRPVVCWSVEASRPWSTGGIVLVVPAGCSDSYGADVVIEGGPTRSDSVRRGLSCVPEAADVIIVHDAARPLASPALFSAVFQAVTSDGADAAVPGLPVHDTIKVVDGDHKVTATLNRSTLVAVQTPQAFSADLLRRAHHGGSDATDDAALVERLGATVRVVPGEERNLKITTPDDLRAAELLIGAGQ
jgi:2-C-methyl-D-erythritol 4-phosphate cytidylyltransferase